MRARPAFVGSWWHGDDLATALAELRSELAEHDLAAALPEARLRADHAAACADERMDDEVLRDHQIGVTAVAANELLAARGDRRRFRAFDRSLGDDSSEPAWFLVQPAEHERMRAESGALHPRDAIYDAATAVGELPPIDWGEPAPLEYMAPFEARAAANAALASGRYAEALRLWPVAVRDGSHGLLAELAWIETLRQMGDREGACERWRATADAWLAGTHPVWDTQWQRLAELARALGVQDAERLAGIAAHLPAGPPRR